MASKNSPAVLRLQLSKILALHQTNCEILTRIQKPLEAGALNTNAPFHFLFNISTFEFTFKTEDIIDGVSTQKAHAICEAMNKTQPLLPVPDLFNDKMDTVEKLKCHNMNRVKTLNARMCAIAQKYEGFLQHPMAAQALGACLTNLELIQTYVGAIETDMKQRYVQRSDVDKLVAAVNVEMVRFAGYVKKHTIKPVFETHTAFLTTFVGENIPDALTLYEERTRLSPDDDDVWCSIAIANDSNMNVESWCLRIRVERSEDMIVGLAPRSRIGNHGSLVRKGNVFAFYGTEGQLWAHDEMVARTDVKLHDLYSEDRNPVELQCVWNKTLHTLVFTYRMQGNTDWQPIGTIPLVLKTGTTQHDLLPFCCVWYASTSAKLIDPYDDNSADSDNDNSADSDNDDSDASDSDSSDDSDDDDSDASDSDSSDSSDDSDDDDSDSSDDSDDDDSDSSDSSDDSDEDD